jgi:hypothetical protein
MRWLPTMTPEQNAVVGLEVRTSATVLMYSLGIPLTQLDIPFET